MEITYNLTINKIECFQSYSGLTNVVNKIYWTYKGYDETNTFASSINGITEIPFNDNNEFILFENLTSEQVSNWILDIISEEIDTMRNSIYENIFLEKNSNIITVNPPWNN